MNCPVCKVELRMMDRQGIEIDYCPQCRGVWLDRGELDKLIERSTAEAAPAAPARTVPEAYPAPAPRRDDDRYDDRRDHGHSDHRDSHGYDGHKRKKKESFLGDMFDFGD